MAAKTEIPSSAQCCHPLGKLASRDHLTRAMLKFSSKSLLSRHASPRKTPPQIRLSTNHEFTCSLMSNRSHSGLSRFLSLAQCFKLNYGRLDIDLVGADEKALENCTTG
ncbi:hypothetical protein CDAR_313611 [Caerostris darwini]|uniref:Uncharacterized protein n=1 Tax=Caerostris darwini TaxID=1538125 RepID=A0AAV4N119_9ARAC|nr:hypothetical protein CDAR_313611 [Caerostris darwini]